MNKLGIEEGIIKIIDGEMYYKSHYCYWLYTQLEEMQNKIDKAIEYITSGSDFKSIYFKKTDEELWKILLEDNIKNDLLDILRGEDNE